MPSYDIRTEYGDTVKVLPRAWPLDTPVLLQAINSESKAVVGADLTRRQALRVAWALVKATLQP